MTIFRRSQHPMDPGVVKAGILRAWFWLGIGFAMFGTAWALVPHSQALVPPWALVEWLRNQHEALRILLESDKLDHVVSFALLMAWFCQLYESSPSRARVAMALLAQAAGIEIMQGFTTWRTAEFGDWVAGAVGIGLGWLASSPRTPNLLRGLLSHPI